MKKIAQSSKIKFIKDIDSERLILVLKNYDYEKLNVLPNSENDLLRYYEQYADPIITESKRLTDNNVFPLGNEVRAMIGHLADYQQNTYDRNNLKNAYGHFRRLNIDAFKIICDEADKSLLKYLDSHKYYDFRNVNAEFLKTYSTMYFSAKEKYLDAQLSERTGSDRRSGNVLKEYQCACLKYAELLSYLKRENKGLNTKIIKTIVGMVVSSLIAISSLILSIYLS